MRRSHQADGKMEAWKDCPGATTTPLWVSLMLPVIPDRPPTAPLSAPEFSLLEEGSKVCGPLPSAGKAGKP